MCFKNFNLPIFSQKKPSDSFLTKINTFILKSFSIKILNIIVWIYSLSLSGYLLNQIHNDEARYKYFQERVLACGAGFSEAAQASLHAAYRISAMDGKISAHGKEISQAVIFSQLPEQDRLKGYEDYIRCLEAHLNPD